MNIEDRHSHPDLADKTQGVRQILLSGVFWRLLIIEGILLIWSLAYRLLAEGAGPADLFWYGVRIIILVGIILAFMMFTLQRFLSKKIILPLEAIARANLEVQENEPESLSIQEQLPPDNPREIKGIVSTRSQMLKTILDVSNKRLQLMEFIRETFGRYLSDKVVKEILDSPQGHQVGGQRATVTILMADLRGFTTLSEQKDPEEMVRLLNRFLERMSRIIVDSNGIIDEIIGDAILAIFGVPEEQDDDPERAVACAIAMQNGLLKLNEELAAEGYPPLEMGIGINTGTVIVGNIGSEVRIKYGVVGTAVNTAARIESNSVGGQVLIGESTFLQAKDLLRVEPPQTAMMKGLKEPLVFYAVNSIGPPYNQELKTCPHKENGAEIKLPFSCFAVDDKKIISQAMSGETVLIHENQMDVFFDTRLEVLTNLKLQFEFCVDAHCFEEFYAKIVSQEELADGRRLYRIKITAMDPKDREKIHAWADELRS